VGAYAARFRPAAIYIMIGSAALLGTVLVLAAAGSLRRALPRNRSGPARIGYDVIAVVVVLLIPAGVWLNLTSRCVRVDSGPDDTEIQYACTVTYAGHDMVFTVIGSGRRETGELDRYEASADRVVVTRKGLQSQFREAYPQAEELRCDEFPELALVSTADHCLSIATSRSVGRADSWS
jgi:hypothetical protein